MSHFGSADWNNPSGLVASLASPTTTLQLEATASTSIEGTDKLTYRAVRTGMYRVSATMKVTEASDAATSHTLVAQVAYNDGSAISAENISLDGVTAGTANGKTLNANFAQSTMIRAVTGTDIVITVLNTVVGAKTAGVGEYALLFAIEAV